MAQSRDLAPIENGVTYPLPEFERRTGLGRYTMRQARRKGLPVFQVGNRRYIRGEDFNAWLMEQLPHSERSFPDDSQTTMLGDPATV